MFKIGMLLWLYGVVLVNPLKAQDHAIQTPAKNVVHASIGSFVFIHSVHLSYDRLILVPKKGFFKSYYATAKTAFNEEVGISRERSDQSFPITLGIMGLTGSGKNHLEFGLGVQYYHNGKNNPIATNNSFSPSVTIGYRKQAIKGFMLRTGVGISEWVYFGLGYSF